jgi:hypothetical protein
MAGQGSVKDRASDRRIAANREGPTGQGRVANPGEDKRLARNRDGTNGIGRVTNQETDRGNKDDANLIAAAPELYDALAALLGGDDKLRVAIGGNPIYVDAFLAKARAVLKKARVEVA